MNEKESFTDVYLWAAVIVLFTSTGVLASMNLWGLQFLSKPLDYSRFGTWTQAISGAATFCGVMVALSSFLWQQDKARKENARKLTDEQTAVYLWLTWQVLQEEVTHKVIGRHWDLEVHNLTNTPIYTWRVEFRESPVVISNSNRRPLLPGRNIFNLPHLDNRQPSEAPMPSIFFTSRDGKEWSRTAAGTIRNIKSA